MRLIKQLRAANDNLEYRVEALEAELRRMTASAH